MPRPRQRANGEGSTYRVASGKWVADIPLPNGRRQKRSAQTASAARALLRQMLADRDRPVQIDQNRTLNQFLDEWLAETVKLNLKPRTYDAYESVLRLHVRPTLGTRRLVAITGTDLRHLYAARQKTGLGGTTVKQIHVVLHTALSVAVREQLLERNPADHVQAPRATTFEAAPLTLKDATKLLTMLREHRHGPLWSFMLGTGLRIGEASSLLWTDVNLDGAIAVVRRNLSRHSIEDADGQRRWIRTIAETKSARSRRPVPLPPFVVAALRQQRVLVDQLQATARRWNDLGLVFPTLVGTPLREDHVLKQFKVALKAIDVEPRRLHDLRHSLAGLLLDSESADLATVSRLLGHADVATTDGIYAGRMQSAQRAAAERLGRLLEPDSEA